MPLSLRATDVAAPQKKQGPPKRPEE